MSAKPILAITMGDPAGIGAEVALKALEHPEVWEICRPVVIGDARRLAEAAQVVHSRLPVRGVRSVSELGEQESALDSQNRVSGTSPSTVCHTSPSVAMTSSTARSPRRPVSLG